VTLSTDVLLGLAAALGFGTADFIARHATQRLGYLSTLFFLQTIGSLGLLPFAVFYERAQWQAADPWMWIVGLGVFNLLGAMALYRSLEYGVLSVVAPLTSMAPAISTVLAVVLLGERPSGRVVAGIAVVLLGVAALTRSGLPISGPPPKDARIGLVSGFLALLALGGLSIGLKVAAAAIGPMTTIVTVRFVGVVVVLVGALCRVTPVARLPRDRWRQMLALTLIDTSAFVAFTTGIRIGSVAIVATLTGLYAAVTVGLAAFLLGERLRPASYASIGVMMVGVTLILFG
jgi:drug/metabolite transporter (DMT)-like permease